MWVRFAELGRFSISGDLVRRTFPGTDGVYKLIPTRSQPYRR